MEPGTIGLLVAASLFLLLAIRVPVAFALGIVAIMFPVMLKGTLSISTLGEQFFGGLAEFTLLSIPMFIVMGAAVAASPAGKDLYEALDRWLNRVPGGLIISNIGACSIFA
ncbi:MAG TPA: TRAP transporter large permease subunit, partial [Rhizobiales bacterium]|nr:TRAP transporter large permease subunit [Hyphomicrobiales bacterium]